MHSKSPNLVALAKTLAPDTIQWKLPEYYLQAEASSAVEARIKELTGHPAEAFWGEINAPHNVLHHARNLCRGRCMIMVTCQCGCGGLEIDYTAEHKA